MVVEGILTTVASILTTVVAFVLGKYVWNWYRKPVLRFTGCSTKHAPGGSVVPAGNSVPIIYRIHVTNNGSTAAQNCKAEIALSGSDGSETHELDTTTCWSERDNPPRVTINAGETTSFDFFVQFKTNATKFIRFPSESGWPDYSTLILPKKSMNRIPVSDLVGVDFDTSKVQITSENAALVEGDVTINWDLGKGVEVAELEINQTEGAFCR